MRIRLKVKEVATRQHLTRAALARRADLTYETVFKLWNDPYRDVSLMTLVKIAQVLQVDVSDLYEVDEEDK